MIGFLDTGKIHRMKRDKVIQFNASSMLVATLLHVAAVTNAVQRPISVLPLYKSCFVSYD